jgi:hypothetical protein
MIGIIISVQFKKKYPPVTSTIYTYRKKEKKIDLGLSFKIA